MALQRAAIISGRVADENGEPVGDVNVYAMRPQFYQGRREMARVAIGANRRHLGIPHPRARTGHLHGVGQDPRDLVDPRSAETDAWLLPHVFPIHRPRRRQFARSPWRPVKRARSTHITLVFASAASISGMATRSDGTPLRPVRGCNLSENYRGPFGSSFQGITSALSEGRLVPGRLQRSRPGRLRTIHFHPYVVTDAVKSARHDRSLYKASTSTACCYHDFRRRILTGEVIDRRRPASPICHATGSKLRVVAERN